MINTISQATKDPGLAPRGFCVTLCLANFLALAKFNITRVPGIVKRILSDKIMLQHVSAGEIVGQSFINFKYCKCFMYRTIHDFSIVFFIHMAQDVYDKLFSYGDIVYWFSCF